MSNSPPPNNLRLRRLFVPPLTICALFTLLGSHAIAADNQVHLVWIRNRGAESCPDDSEIIKRITTRLGPAAISDQAPRLLEAEVRRDSNLWRAQISERDSTGKLLGSRSFQATAADCGPITDALTLGLVLTIDPRAALLPPPLAVASASASNPAPIAPANSCPVPPPPAPTYLPAPCPQCLPSPAPSSKQMDFGARALVASQMLPSTAFGTAFAGTAEVSPSWRLQLGILWLPEVRSADRRFGFGTTAGWLGACRLGAHTERVDLDVCAQLEIGATHAVVYEKVPTQPGDYLWTAVAAGPKFRFDFIQGILLETGFEGIIPLYRPEFAVKGEAESVFQASLIGFRGYLGVGVRIP